ncbi:MAG: hypothetical protein ACR5K4_02005 [Sodalis sp. (in: enterobacteria)]
MTDLFFQDVRIIDRYGPGGLVLQRRQRPGIVHEAVLFITKNEYNPCLFKVTMAPSKEILINIILTQNEKPLLLLAVLNNSKSVECFGLDGGSS